mmetsp:Transcript_80665/g.231658  ORF Transcript_80665/g.231658 Transcript_80665/m.231658 type:complete len:287 (+) Transcript_80665:1471-2331(+)
MPCTTPRPRLRPPRPSRRRAWRRHAGPPSRLRRRAARSSAIQVAGPVAPGLSRSSRTPPAESAAPPRQWASPRTGSPAECPWPQRHRGQRPRARAKRSRRGAARMRARRPRCRWTRRHPRRPGEAIRLPACWPPAFRGARRRRRSAALAAVQRSKHPRDQPRRESPQPPRSARGTPAPRREARGAREGGPRQPPGPADRGRGPARGAPPRAPRIRSPPAALAMRSRNARPQMPARGPRPPRPGQRPRQQQLGLPIGSGLRCRCRASPPGRHSMDDHAMPCATQHPA